MLTRERIALRLLQDAGRSLPRTTFVKLMFLLRMETALSQYSSFYDFVPYKYGPYSFALYRDLFRLKSSGYVAGGDSFVSLNESLLAETRNQTEKLAKHLQFAVADIAKRYGQMKVSPLIQDVYKRYGWFALNSERAERKRFSIPARPKAPPAIYTLGYEGKSVDAFFNYLLEKGIETIIDVRSNPVSRKYGFAGRRMEGISESLGIEYRHCPSLGVPSRERATLRDNASLKLLLSRYEQHIRDSRRQEILEVGEYMRRVPSVLVCVEKDVECCHRSRLARAIAKETSLGVINL